MEYKDASLYNTLRSQEQNAKMQILAKELEDVRTLDVGCGTGLSSAYFSDVMGIDPEPALLAANPCPCIKGKAESLPFKDKEFEQVIAVTSIHNFENIEKGLQEMKRVGKRFGVSVLKKTSKFAEIDALLHSLFTLEKVIDEGTDMIYILSD